MLNPVVYSVYHKHMQNQTKGLRSSPYWPPVPEVFYSIRLLYTESYSLYNLNTFINMGKNDIINKLLKNTLLLHRADADAQRADDSSSMLQCAPVFVAYTAY